MAWLGRIGNLWRRRKVDDDIDAELRAHLEMRADDNVVAGMGREEARRDAAVRFGNVTLLKERTRAAEFNQVCEGVWRDVTYAARQLRRSPGFAATAVVTLGLAIAANVVVFAVLNALVLRGNASGQLFNVVQGPYGYENQSYPDYLDYRRYNSTFADLAAYRLDQAGMKTPAGAAKAWGYQVSGNYFDLMKVKPALGRFFHASDEHGAGSAPYIVLSDAFWRSHFGADPHVLGKMVEVNRHPFTVIGVAGASFYGVELFIRPDFWMPIVNEEQVSGYNFLNSRYNHTIWVLGRLKAGVTVRQATENLNAIAARLGKQYPSDAGMKARLVQPGLLGEELGDPARAFLTAMMFLALLVLLAASVNMAGIFAARVADRFRELAIRLAIGSSRWHVLRQLLTETMMISVLGGVLGAALAAGMLVALNAWRPFVTLPIQVSVNWSAGVYLFAVVLSLASGITPGLVPARQLLRTELTQAIRSDVMVGGRARRLKLRDVLLSMQIALCALLLTSSLVALRGMNRALHSPLGFDPEGVLLVEAKLMANASNEQVLVRQAQMLKEAEQLPGVTAAGIINDAPLAEGGGGGTTPVYAVGTAELTPPHARFSPEYYSITPGYLKAAETRLLAGRDVTWHDVRNAPLVALVNEQFAREMFGDSSAVGKHFLDSAGRLVQVVGVVQDGKYNSLTEAPRPAMFFSFAQSPVLDTTLVVRSELPTAQMAAELSDMLRHSSPNLPFTVESWMSALALVLFPARAATASLGVMGLLAVMLAVTGVFGMAATAVSKRKKEFAIRMALGSQTTQLLRAALLRPMVLLLAGSVAGLLLGVLASTVLQQIVYDATPRDPLVWAGVVLSMVSLGIAATWVPAQRALRIDPAKLLKEDA